MKKIKNDELRKLNDTELDKTLLEVRKNLMKANAQIATGTVPENPGEVKILKKTIARIHTIKSEKRRVGKKV